MEQGYKREDRNYFKDNEFLIRLNITLTSNHDYRTNIKEALKSIGKHCQSDRIHIFRIYPDRTFSILYEWCNHSIPPVKDLIKKQRCFYEKSLEEQLNTQDYIEINQPASLENEELKRFLGKCAIVHTLILPLFTRNFFSFITFSHCGNCPETEKAEIHYLSVIAAILAANIDKNMLVFNLMSRLKKSQNEQYAAQ